jgi:hypothetical protein
VEQEKTVWCIRTGMPEMKLALLSDGLTIWMESPKESAVHIVGYNIRKYV